MKLSQSLRKQRGNSVKNLRHFEPVSTQGVKHVADPKIKAFINILSDYYQQTVDDNRHLESSNALKKIRSLTKLEMER
jgi:hypothetical protein